MPAGNCQSNERILYTGGREVTAGRRKDDISGEVGATFLGKMFTGILIYYSCDDLLEKVCYNRITMETCVVKSEKRLRDTITGCYKIVPEKTMAQC